MYCRFTSFIRIELRMWQLNYPTGFLALWTYTIVFVLLYRKHQVPLRLRLFWIRSSCHGRCRLLISLRMIWPSSINQITPEKSGEIQQSRRKRSLEKIIPNWKSNAICHLHHYCDIQLPNRQLFGKTLNKSLKSNHKTFFRLWKNAWICFSTLQKLGTPCWITTMLSNDAIILPDKNHHNVPHESGITGRCEIRCTSRQ